MSKAETMVPQLRFEGFSGEWKTQALSDVAKIVGGGTPDTTIPEYWNGDINWYSPTEIGLTRFVKESTRKITDLGFQKSSARLLPANQTVLFTSRAGIGDMAILEAEGTTNQGFQSLIVNDHNDVYFIYSMGHLIKREALRVASGSTFLEISGKALGKIKQQFPLKKEQIKIGELFQKIDRVIELQQQKVEQSERYKKAMLQKMFPQKGEKVPRVRFEGFSGDWDNQKLGNCTKLITKGTTPKFNNNIGEINFIKVENLNNGEINPTHKTSKFEHEHYLKRSQLEDGDILFSIAGTLGRTAIVSKRILPANTNQALSIIRGYNFDTYFLVTTLSGNIVEEYVRKNPTVGAQPNLSLEQVRSLEIFAPKLSEQTKIGEFFQALDARIEAETKKLNHYESLKKAMLQRMFV